MSSSFSIDHHILQKQLSPEEQATFNQFTNVYIRQLVTLDPVLAVKIKDSILERYVDSDQDYTGTMEKLHTELQTPLEEDAAKLVDIKKANTLKKM